MQLHQRHVLLDCDWRGEIFPADDNVLCRRELFLLDNQFPLERINVGGQLLKDVAVRVAGLLLHPSRVAKPKGHGVRRGQTGEGIRRSPRGFRIWFVAVESEESLRIPVNLKIIGKLGRRGCGTGRVGVLRPAVAMRWTSFVVRQGAC